MGHECTAHTSEDDEDLLQLLDGIREVGEGEIRHEQKQAPQSTKKWIHWHRRKTWGEIKQNDN